MKIINIGIGKLFFSIKPDDESPGPWMQGDFTVLNHSFGFKVMFHHWRRIYGITRTKL